jgi:hypothetical protein
MTIESIRELVGIPAFDVGRVQEQATQAIESLRRAIVQLRAAQTEEISALALGFVAADGGSAGVRRNS